MANQPKPPVTEYGELQIEAGLSNTKAADLFEVNLSTIKRWKNGTSEYPHAAILVLQRIIEDNKKAG